MRPRQDYEVQERERQVYEDDAVSSEDNHESERARHSTRTHHTRCISTYDDLGKASTTLLRKWRFRVQSQLFTENSLKYGNYLPMYR